MWRLAALGIAAAAATALTALVPTPATTIAPTRPAHVVIVVDENHSYSETISAPYIASLAKSSANMAQSYAVAHPSEPNYVALWSGSTHGLTDDSCPHNYGTSGSLGGQLLAKSLTVAGFSESMPSAGYLGCSSGGYARKHNPLADFSATTNQYHNKTFSAWPASDLSHLPTVALVVPNLCNDMHDCSVSTGDTWLKTHLNAYAIWARTHNSILIVTFDEDDHSSGNRIVTLISGQHVQPGSYSQRITHYNVLSTIESFYGLSHLNPASAITGIWK